jgi:hypothetical protein
MKKCCTEPRRRGMSYVQYIQGRLTGLVISFVRNAVGVFWRYNPDISLARLRKAMKILIRHSHIRHCPKS